MEMVYVLADPSSSGCDCHSLMTCKATVFSCQSHAVSLCEPLVMSMVSFH
jgi:hypothetical protein